MCLVTWPWTCWTRSEAGGDTNLATFHKIAHAVLML